MVSNTNMGSISCAQTLREKITAQGLTAYSNPANKVDEVKISEQDITIYSESAVETGRATAIKKW